MQSFKNIILVQHPEGQETASLDVTLLLSIKNRPVTLRSAAFSQAE